MSSTRNIKSEDYYLRRHGKHTAWSLELKAIGADQTRLILNSHDLRFADDSPAVWIKCTISGEAGTLYECQNVEYSVGQHKKILLTNFPYSMFELGCSTVNITFVLKDVGIEYSRKVVEDNVEDLGIKEIDVSFGRRRIYKLWTSKKPEYDLRSG